MATLSFNQMRKTLVSNQPELYNTQLLLKQSLYNRVRNKLFWIWDKEQHKQADIDNNGDCCLNHIIGLPKKDDVEKPIFDYEKTIHDILEIDKKKYIWIKKSTGLGVTEFFLRYIAWICTRDNAMKDNKRIC